MSTHLVPADVQLAARRAFLRTTAQSYAATIPAGGVTAAAIAALIQRPDPVLIIATVAAALISPPLAGLASYLSILSRGIPEAYLATSAVVDDAATLTPDERAMIRGLRLMEGRDPLPEVHGAGPAT